MTMKVTIRNEDAGRTAEVQEEEHSSRGFWVETAPKARLAPGTQLSFYIHAARRLIVTEDPDATIPKP